LGGNQGTARRQIDTTTGAAIAIPGTDDAGAVLRVSAAT